MRWQGNRESDNVEDVRGRGGRAGGLGGGKLGLGGVAIALVASYFLGINPMTVLNLLGGGGGPTVSAPDPNAPPANDEETRFVRTILADTEDVWRVLFQQAGGQYQDPKLVLFRGAVPTACGTGQSAMGPFYCPGDGKVYIDLSFYRELKRNMNAPGDFSQAYVIAHEVGHHVQNLLGLSRQMESMRRQVSKTEYNRLSVKMELQADCFAGLWAHHAHRARQVVEPGDIDEALNAASQIGDDRLQKQQRGYVTPDSFTHGTSAQRVSWFQRGYQTGRFDNCDTFNAASL